MEFQKQFLVIVKAACFGSLMLQPYLVPCMIKGAVPLPMLGLWADIRLHRKNITLSIGINQLAIYCIRW
jgi:hypothetical protein